MGNSAQKNEKKLLSALDGGTSHYTAGRSARVSLFTKSESKSKSSSAFTLNPLSSILSFSKYPINQSANKPTPSNYHFLDLLLSHLRECQTLSGLLQHYIGFKLEFATLSFQDQNDVAYIEYSNLSRAALKAAGVLIIIKQEFQHELGPTKITSVRGFYTLYYYLKDLWACFGSISSNTFELEFGKLCFYQSEAINDDDTIVSSENGDYDTEIDIDCDEFSPNQREVEVAIEGQQAKFEYESKCDDEDETTMCPICLDSAIEYVLPCNHAICESCYNDWTNRRSNCPMCRRELDEGDEESLWVFSSLQDSEAQAIIHVNQLVPLIHDFIFSVPRIELDFSDVLRYKFQNVASESELSKAPAVKTTSINDKKQSLYQESAETPLTMAKSAAS
uniref:RING-type domain-containing protein n=1 Tax=Aplanochytrium stocchinoi TaxID=215587 RepID=A0A7S3V3F7_9STRA|mmetsp:Transcript_20404/g.24786  ORF Transcript_20404/g.24786 Transcript_20404/m.24786 type:complete len:391 (+) Transcript_20404:435-1607(+)|eukprot:CAMPEP_0204828118 /NCGR_PEP_ID=MMETSP1346-20131115/5743_1 /ASSEMBLY_ACC=CAM_ASM_000771 /TAXON_ID=215587 /ORGANISM="Aplanochytrium stocchinoi, Strain GSBS06" /LENGTH=390 /DNA_ID=CAMNT_0051956955 /DNA_START=386 /DNA_END=1558 /DNA_ORIENTATION=+